ncbi:hypothetical protein KY285_008618 [Solanum tuberosum]|nr:hypothetical protein KY285_008618 [Solanum tuberosum]
MAEKKRAIKTAENEFFSTWNGDFSEEMIEVMEDIGDDMMEMIKWNEDYPGPPVWDSELDEIEAEEEQQGEPGKSKKLSTLFTGERKSANLLE